MTTKDRLEDILYAAGMESPNAEQNMESLCAACGVQYPPRTLQQQADDYQREQIASANSHQPFN